LGLGEATARTRGKTVEFVRRIFRVQGFTIDVAMATTDQAAGRPDVVL
jgi:hypothetical protein